MFTRRWIGSLRLGSCLLHVPLTPSPPTKYCTHYTAGSLSGSLSTRRRIMSRLHWKLVCQRRQHVLRSLELSAALVLKWAPDALALRPHDLWQWSLLFSSLSSHPASDICMFHPWRMVYLARLILQPQKLDLAFIRYVLPPLILILQDFSYADFNLAYCLLCTPPLPLQLKLKIKGNRGTRSP